MPRSGAAVPRGETDGQSPTLSTGDEREAFVSGGFGPDDSVFERFGRAGLASERFRGHDAESESYRVEVDRYWRRTASRRAAAEARRADGFARADRAVARSRRAERADRPDHPEAAERPAAAERALREPQHRPAPPAPWPENGDPYREMLHAWARETAEEPRIGSGRRTVSIKGHGAEGFATRNGTRESAAERYRQPPRHERSGFQPDRVAMWAVLLGMMMVLAAAASAHAAVVVHHLH